MGQRTQTPKGAFLLSDSAYEQVYAPEAAAAIRERVDIVTLGSPEMRDVELVFSGWDCPRMDKAFLDAMPRLKAVFYAGGTIGPWVTPAVWERGIIVTTANTINARPVADYAVATILFSLKQGWRTMRQTRERRDFTARHDITGNFRSVVRLVSFGTIARILLELLKPFGPTVLTYHPFLTDAEAAAFGVTKVSLQRLFVESDVVSLHAPALPSTRGMIDRPLLSSMKPGATFINTARGSIVREADLIQVLTERPDLHAVLDVTDPEPPLPDSPLYTLPNVVLTPHIAGSQGRERERMGLAMVDELDRYLREDVLQWQVRPHDLERSAHQAKG